MAENDSRKLFSDEQINALEALIVYSNKSAIGNKTLIWALRQTRNLTKPVAITIPYRTKTWVSRRFDDDDYWNWAKLAFDCSHGITSAIGLTHLGLVMRAMGSEFIISEYQDRTGGARIFISPIIFDESLDHIDVPYEEVQAIKVASLDGAHNSEGKPFMNFQRERV